MFNELEGTFPSLNSRIIRMLHRVLFSFLLWQLKHFISFLKGLRSLLLLHCFWRARIVIMLVNEQSNYSYCPILKLKGYLFDSDLPVISQICERLIAELDCHDLISLPGVRLPIYYSTWFKCTSLKKEYL